MGSVWERESGRRAFRERGVGEGQGLEALLSLPLEELVCLYPLQKVRRNWRAYPQEGDMHAKG